MNSLRQIFGYGLVVVLFVGGFVAVNRSQDIIDWWKLRDYEPSARIEAISEAASFTELGERLFYVHDPTILSDKEAFAESCRTSNEIIVLGCYVTNQGIFMFDVEDERLNGIIEVTAAHEMLHAAFDRLSLSEQDEIVKLLEAEFAVLRVENERLSKTIEAYKARDPSVVGNELHSILGTEIRKLSKPLEDHYTRYFQDRLAVVTLAETYEEEFIKRENKIAGYDRELNELNGSISRLEADIGQQSQALEAERRLLEGLRGSPEEFNAGIPRFNTNVNAYNAEVNRLKTLVESYNEVVADRNKIALEERDLVEAIDSRIETL